MGFVRMILRIDRDCFLKSIDQFDIWDGELFSLR
jgi:hypothetical protein